MSKLQAMIDQAAAAERERERLRAEDRREREALIYTKMCEELRDRVGQALYDALSEEAPLERVGASRDSMVFTFKGHPWEVSWKPGSMTICGPMDQQNSPSKKEFTTHADDPERTAAALIDTLREIDRPRMYACLERY